MKKIFGLLVMVTEWIVRMRLRLFHMNPLQAAESSLSHAIT
ncbi:MAG: hypothetical protein QXR97_06995 [Thermoproteota archaeon]